MKKINKKKDESEDKNLIYLKLDYPEVFQSKKDILSSEISLLESVKILRKYRQLRITELKTKLKLYKKIKEVIDGIRKIQRSLPVLENPEIKGRSREEREILMEKNIGMKKSDYDEGVDSQLQEIRDKLYSLQNK